MSLKRCPYCRKLFKPDPRTAYEQRVCFEEECQKKRKRDAQKKWRKKNPTYFHGHYPRVKKWIDEHPDYLKNYRRNNINHASAHMKKETKQEESAHTDAPVSMPAWLETRIVELEQFWRKLPCCDIQDAIEAKKPDFKPFCTQFTPG